MATIAPITPQDYQAGSYRLSVHQYERMAEAGILTEGDRVELLDGFLLQKMTKNEPHSAACTEIRLAIEKWIPPGWYLRLESPLRVSDFDEPEPDLAIVRGSSRTYVRLGRPPEPGEVALVVEVADASLMPAWCEIGAKNGGRTQGVGFPRTGF